MGLEGFSFLLDKFLECGLPLKVERFDSRAY